MSNKKSSKKVSKKQAVKSAEQRPAKRKKIVSLAEYEAEAKALRQADEKTEPVTGPATEGANAPMEAVTSAKATKKKDRKPSGLDAAVTVLAEAGKPMNCGDMVKRMLETGLWQTNGKTPAATLAAGILCDKHGRFNKAAPGHWELTEAGKAMVPTIKKAFV